MLKIKYSDPPETDKERLSRQNNNGPMPQNNLDITDYVTKLTWSGDSDQAARKVDFSIVYNMANKDKAFIPLDLKVGGFIYLYYQESAMSDEIEIFEGRIFYRKRQSEGYAFDFTCFDDMIYLAKSNMRAIISGTASAAITQVCNEIQIPVGTLPADLSCKVNFICDDKSCTEAIRMILDNQQAADLSNGKDTYYLPVCINGKVNIIKKGELITGYIATADTNITAAEHSENIENMVNRIKAVDDNGTVCQMFTNNDDVKHFGMIQKIYKMQPPKDGETVDNVKAAKAKLSRQKDESSLKGTGYIQCITGYAIQVQEEQLKGKFYIKSDTHTFDNGIHTMDLTLEYIPDNPEQPEIEQVDYASPVFNSSSNRMDNDRNVSNGSQSVDAGLSAGWSVWGGHTMKNGAKGCAEFAGKCGSYYSPFMAKEAKNGVVSCNGLVSDAKKAGLLTTNTKDIQKGDILVYGNNKHVVIYDGQGGYYGNSSSRNVTVHSGNYADIGLPVTKVIKASRG
ncbi:hypothetical protein [Allisonella histaminiformans]|uniref:XkdQ/YqbQ family protein n=1 Tax=Allisonella histaminiformans TaxID=209880 RepID=UPI002E78A27E|nr:hypothetical protein [Allisonella histaminiformans]